MYASYNDSSHSSVYYWFRGDQNSFIYRLFPCLKLWHPDSSHMERNNIASEFSSGDHYGTEASLLMSNAYREIYSKNFNSMKDYPTKYYYQIPADAKPNSSIKVNLGGFENEIRLPDNIVIGETIIIIAPA